MSIVLVVDEVTKWIQKNICSEIKLKVPPEQKVLGGLSLGKNDNAAYDKEYELVTPTALPMYMPTSEKLPPKIKAPIPSIVVQIVEGHDDITKSRSRVKFQLGFTTWNPGLHGKDMYKPIGSQEYEQWTGEESAAHYDRVIDGWKDSWNFVDIARRILQSNTHIDNHSIDMKSGFDFGPYKEENDILDFWPFWLAWLSFFVETDMVRNKNNIEKFL